MYVGKKLKQLRLQLELTQIEMAEKLALSQAYYSGVESGKKKITPMMLQKMETVLQVKKEYFLDTGNDYNITNMGGNKKGVIFNPDVLIDFTPPKKPYIKYDEKEAINIIKSHSYEKQFSKYVEYDKDLQLIDNETKEILFFEIPYRSILKNYVYPAQNIVDISEYKNLTFSKYRSKKIEKLQKLKPLKSALSNFADAIRTLIDELDKSGEDWLEIN